MPWSRSDGPKLADLTPESSKPLNPTRVFWIPYWHQLSKTISIHDITARMAGHWQGAVNKEYRELAKAMYQKYGEAPAFTATAKTALRLQYGFCDAAGRELADWDHGFSSRRDVRWTFPPDGKTEHWHGHPVEMIRANKTFTRDRVFTVDSVMYSVEMDSSWRTNQFTIYKIVGNQKVTVARFGQKWAGAWFVGGALVVDTEELDEMLAILAALVMLKQNKQRAAERSHGGGGGG